MTQKLYGYRLLATDENTIGDWSFYNQDKLIGCALKRSNGSIYCYSGEARFLNSWAFDRSLQGEECIFVFDPLTMTFTQET